MIWKGLFIKRVFLVSCDPDVQLTLALTEADEVKL